MNLTNFIESLLDEQDAVVDGHDFGLSEFNIHASEPRAIVEKVGEAVDARLPGVPFSSDYRDFRHDSYIPLWPLGAETFFVA
jgi:hypothetical protein